MQCKKSGTQKHCLTCLTCDYYHIYVLMFFTSKPINRLRLWDVENLYVCPHHLRQERFIMVCEGKNHPVFSSVTPVTDIITIITNQRTFAYFHSEHHTANPTLQLHNICMLWSFLISTQAQNCHREMISLSCEHREEAQEIKLKPRQT